MKLNGQWIGQVQGTNTGLVIMNIELANDEYLASISFFDYTEYTNLPHINFEVAFPSEVSPNEEILLTSNEIKSIELDNFTIAPWESVKDLYGSDVLFPNSISLKFQFNQDGLRFSGTSDAGTSFGGTASKANFHIESELVSQKMSWEEFRIYALSKGNGNVFRGQQQAWKLQTSYHRFGRANLQRYLSQDVPKLRKLVNSVSNHLFDTNNSEEFGALLNLAQHHGYPTPLLDWSHSPYVAAFFAFKDVPKVQANEDKSVRIFVFHQKSWLADVPQSSLVGTAIANISMIELMAIKNNRAIPQQATTMLTNIHDIENFIVLQEKTKSKTYIEAIDIPWSERSNAMRELQLMGITAGSLFPGIDGVCEELKENLF